LFKLYQKKVELCYIVLCTVASDGGYIYSIVACYIVCYRTTKDNHPLIANQTTFFHFQVWETLAQRAKALPRTWKRLCVYRVWSVVSASGLMCTHNGPQRPVSHSNPDRKRGVSECALEGRAAILLIERPCGISCRFSLFFYIHVCAEQRESQIIEHARERQTQATAQKLLCKTPFALK